MSPAEAYILDQEEPFRSMLLRLQLIIDQSLPDLDLKYKYRIPFYYWERTPFCYLNQKKDFVDIGFWHSAHISRHDDKMNTENRKIMKSLRYYSLEEIDETVLVEVLHEAYSYREKGFWK